LLQPTKHRNECGAADTSVRATIASMSLVTKQH
jgi:hypothetical protein